METKFKAVQCFIKQPGMSCLEDTSISISVCDKALNGKRTQARGCFCCVSLKTTSFTSYVSRSILKYFYFCGIFTLLFFNSQYQHGDLKYVFPSKAESNSGFNLCFYKRKGKSTLRRCTMVGNLGPRNAKIQILASLVSTPTPVPSTLVPAERPHCK